MNIYATDPVERKRHPTAPSSVNLPPPHSGSWKDKTGGVSWVHMELFDFKFSDFFYTSLCLVYPVLHNRKSCVFCKRGSMYGGLTGLFYFYLSVFAFWSGQDSDCVLVECRVFKSMYCYFFGSLYLFCLFCIFFYTIEWDLTHPFFSCQQCLSQSWSHGFAFSPTVACKYSQSRCQLTIRCQKLF